MKAPLRFILVEEEGDMAQARTQLHSLFEADDASRNNGNVSLQYKAPKAPKPQQTLAAPSETPVAQAPSPSESGTSSPMLCFSGTCHTYRLSDGGFIPVVPAGELLHRNANTVLFTSSSILLFLCVRIIHHFQRQTHTNFPRMFTPMRVHRCCGGREPRHRCT